MKKNKQFLMWIPYKRTFTVDRRIPSFLQIREACWRRKQKDAQLFQYAFSLIAPLQRIHSRNFSFRYWNQLPCLGQLGLLQRAPNI